MVSTDSLATTTACCASATGLQVKNSMLSTSAEYSVLLVKARIRLINASIITKGGSPCLRKIGACKLSVDNG
ncbi:conserved hypothetical protein [Alteromonas sp. 154]|nr:conserved hypothetical protein [Alteromonas sp. 154]